LAVTKHTRIAPAAIALCVAVDSRPEGHTTNGDAPRAMCHCINVQYARSCPRFQPSPRLPVPFGGERMSSRSRRKRSLIHEKSRESARNSQESVQTASQQPHKTTSQPPTMPITYRSPSLIRTRPFAIFGPLAIRLVNIERLTVLLTVCRSGCLGEPSSDAGSQGVFDSDSRHQFACGRRRRRSCGALVPDQQRVASAALACVS